MKRRNSTATFLREIFRPIGQILLFIILTGLVLSGFMLLLALLLRGSAVDQALVARNNVDLFTYTLSNLPQVLVDGVTLGFVYAAIALGYTMVYGVLEFINFAPVSYTHLRAHETRHDLVC